MEKRKLIDLRKKYKKQIIILISIQIILSVIAITAGIANWSSATILIYATYITMTLFLCYAGFIIIKYGFVVSKNVFFVALGVITVSTYRDYNLYAIIPILLLIYIARIDEIKERKKYILVTGVGTIVVGLVIALRDLIIPLL